MEREEVVGTDGEGTGHEGKGGRNTLPQDTHSRDVAVGTHRRTYTRMPVHTFLVSDVPLFPCARRETSPLILGDA